MKKLVFYFIFFAPGVYGMIPSYKKLDTWYHRNFPAVSFEEEIFFLYDVLKNDTELHDLITYAQEKPDALKSEIIQRYVTLLIERTIGSLLHAGKIKENHYDYLINKLQKNKNFIPSGSSEYDFIMTGTGGIISSCQSLVDEFKEDLEGIKEAIEQERTHES